PCVPTTLTLQVRPPTSAQCTQAGQSCQERGGDGTAERGGPPRLGLQENPEEQLCRDWAGRVSVGDVLHPQSPGSRAGWKEHGSPLSRLLGSVPIPSSCCMSFISKTVSEKRVASYQLSSASVCPMAGVIFTTRKGQKFCGDPKQHWVQKITKLVDARRKKASPIVRAMSTKAPVQESPANTTSI
uniref:C-C motif chemokine ligand 24 n=1 Tax=Ailuropoda melanoleuca TaxID=9646 RepID=A0A7N5JCX8_AILME